MKHLKIGIAVLALAIFQMSCSKSENLTEEVSPLTEVGQDFETSKHYPESSMVLGEQLQNPYALEVMQQAYDNLTNPNSRTNGEKLKETHLYMKFLPENEEEYMILKADSTLLLYNYPLDYEIKIKGNSYQDPEVPIGKPTYQYCSVEAKKELPQKVKYKVLAKLYIPKDADGSFTNIPNGRTSSEFYKELEREAFRLTNNMDDLKNTTSKNAKVAAYVPHGRITVWDDSKNQQIGVEGVEVRARRWFTTYTGITDLAGYFVCNGNFDNDANFSIDWERYNFAIRDGWLSGATYNGPQQSSAWNLYLNSGAQMFYARVFRAAYRYYYRDIAGLKRPPLNSFWNSQMHIRAHNSNGGAYFTSSIFRRFLGIGNPIHIYSKETAVGGSEVTAKAERTFYTVEHELAHASHWELRKNNWNSSTDDRLIESWAMGVGWVLTRLEYSGHNDYAYMTFAEMKDPNFGQSKYTPVIIDLIDNLNQGGCCSTTLPIDYISGYTIKNVEDVLSNCGNLTNLRDQLKNSYVHPQENILDNFFAQYINL